MATKTSEFTQDNQWNNTVTQVSSTQWHYVTIALLLAQAALTPFTLGHRWFILILIILGMLGGAFAFYKRHSLAMKLFLFVYTAWAIYVFYLACVFVPHSTVIFVVKGNLMYVETPTYVRVLLAFIGFVFGPLTPLAGILSILQERRLVAAADVPTNA